jgi:hypothetical protein
VEPYEIVKRWMNYFCQLLNIQRVGGGGIRQTEKQTEKLFVPQPSISEVGTASGNLESFKSSPSADQIKAELIRTGGGLYSGIHTIIRLIWNKKGIA